MKIFFSFTTILFFSIAVSAQINLKKFGSLSISLETNAQYYNEKDNELGFVAPDDRLRSNNYLKINYQLKKITAGVQFEDYNTQGPILGFPENLKGSGLTNYFIGFAAKKYNITLGHFYEQFGSGMTLRAWEDRQLGINNALYGARISLTPTDYLTTKFIYGTKRDAYNTGNGIVMGADVELNISTALKNSWKDSLSSLLVGFSYVQKQEDYNGNIVNYPEKVNLISSRIGYTKNNVSLNMEYGLKSNDGMINDLGNIINTTRYVNGNFLLVTTNITGKNNATNITVRQEKNFAAKTDRKAPLNQLLLNYVPALTKQQHYSLANIYVYNAQSKISFLPGNLLNSIGEIGGQIEWYKNFPKNSTLGGKYGMQLNINFSNYYGLAFDGTDIATAKLYNFKPSKQNYRDLSMEVKKTWSKKTKTVFSYINQLYNQNIIEGYGSEKLATNIIIAEGIFKIKKTQSFKADVQHMWVKEGKGNWAAATTEYNFSSKWNIFLADLYNYGNQYKKVHYYNFGSTYTKKSLRIMASYGRQREGLLCVGGVCRLVPASSGFSLSASYNF